MIQLNRVKIWCTSVPQTRRVCNFCRDSVTIFIWHTGIPKRIRMSQFEFSTLIGDYTCILCRNLVRFGSVSKEFKAQEIVQPASNVLLGLLKLRSQGGGTARHCAVNNR